MALNTVARHKGHKAMEESLTIAGRVRRQLKAGRWPSKHSLRPHEALGRIVSAADRGRSLMREATLDPDDVRLGLIIRNGTDIACKRLPAPEETGNFFASISTMTDAHFLGILWEQTDREAAAKGQAGFITWITPFVAEPEAQQQLLALQALIRATGTRMN